MKQRKKHAALRTMAALLAACATAGLTSCTENESKISDTVWGTTIPVSELGKESSISAEDFKLATEGKYYQLKENYCRWEGSSLYYIQTSDQGYGLHVYSGDAFPGPNWGVTYYEFKESEVSIFTLYGSWKERKYAFEYNESVRAFFTPIHGTSGQHACWILYIDDQYIIAETDVYYIEGVTAEARRAAAQADCVLLVFKVVKNPVENFLEFIGEADS